jgi:general secretion pathway protein D
MMAADSAKSLFNQGAKAEARQDYEAAYNYYKAAYEKKPTELKYRVPYERLRFQAAASKVHRGQKLRDDGKLQDALFLFEQAASIDPSNDLAAQEIRRTQGMMQKQQGIPPKPTSQDDTLRKRLEDALPPARLNGIPNTPLPALEMTNDSKAEYETIAKLANLNVLFDPDYTSRRLSISLRNVTLQEALDILALQSRTFWRPVTPNTIFVAADTQAKRRELEQNVIKTFYLGNVSTPTDLQDIVNAIRTVLEVQRIQQIPSQNAIVIKGTPDQLALAQKMVDDIDKSKPEVVIDVIVAQVRRDKARTLGIVPPQNASVALQPPGITVVSPSPSPGSTPTSNGLNFNNIQHLNSTSYAVTISPVTAAALFNDSDSKILQSPRIRASNGEKATLKIADRIPIATGSFGTPTGLTGAIGTVGVNTQFTYTDVGVIMDITPTIHPDGQVTLKTSLEISNVSSQSTIGGITQPVISQRKEESVMRLNDGEINMLGGILEQQQTKTVSGTPFLGQIPILRWIFSQETKDVVTNEIVFLLVPHVIRGQELSDLNRRVFDVGTGTGIDLRLGARPPELPPGAAAIVSPPTPATNPTGVPATNPAATTPPSRPPAATAPTPVPMPAAPADANAAPGQTSLRLDPGTVTQNQGGVFTLSVVMSNGQDISGVRAVISYDPKVMQLVSATDGGFMGKDGKSAPLQKRDDPANGQVVMSAIRPAGTPGVSGDGTVFNLTFLAKAKGSGTVSISTPGVRNSQNQPVQVQGSQTSVTVN